MKTKTIFYWGSVLLFIILFYDNFVGINLSILTLVICIASYFLQKKKGLTYNYWIAFVGSILSALSFAYYGGFFSFLCIWISLHWMAMLMFNPRQKLIKLSLLAPLNYLMSSYYILVSNLEIPKKENNTSLKKIFAFIIIPLFISFIFSLVYIASSDLASDYINSVQIDIKVGVLMGVIFLGTLFMYFFWFFKIPQHWLIVQSTLPDEYSQRDFVVTENYDLVRKSGEITFVMLNLLLLIFIAIYGFENLYEKENIYSVSGNLHQRIYAIILSIVMAISLILYLFKGQFNFDEHNKNLKKLSFVWVGLNALLVFIAFAKNIQYVYMLGLTEKRIGVFIFLILCWVGLYLTFKKLKFRKTNWFLIHRMTTTIYITCLIMAIFNWGWIITKFNIETHIPIENDLSYYRYVLDGNQVLLYKYLIDTHNLEQAAEIKSSIINKDYQLKIDGKLQPLWTKYKITHLP